MHAVTKQLAMRCGGKGQELRLTLRLQVSGVRLRVEIPALLPQERCEACSG